MVPFTQSVSKEGALPGYLRDRISLSQLVRKEPYLVAFQTDKPMVPFTQSVSKGRSLTW